MHVDVRFTPEMIEILKSLVGQTLLRLEYSYLTTSRGAKYVYECVRLHLNDAPVDLSNALEYYPDFGDEIARFTCERITDGRPYPLAKEPGLTTTQINRRITGVELIHDTVDLSHQETVLEFHAALIFNTDAGDLIFFRHAWWADSIGIAINRDYDELYPVSQEVDLWENEDEPVDEHFVFVTRRRERIA